MNTKTLSHTQIQHDFFTATGNGVCANITVKSLDLSTLTATAVTQSTKDLTSLASTELKALRGLSLQAGDRTTELKHRLRLFHALTLEDHIFEPVVRGFDLSRHVRKFHSDHGVVDQTLAEGLTLVRVLHGFFVADAREARTLNDNTDALVVEVRHDNLESLVFFADQVLNGDFDVLECNICCAGGPDALAVHFAGADAASLALNEQHTETVHAIRTGPHGSREVIRVDTVRDPLLLTVDDVMLSILRELSLATQVRNVTTRIRFRDSETNALVAVQDTGEDSIDKRLLAELHKRRASNAVPTNQVPHQSTAAGSRELVRQQHLVEQIPSLGRYGLNSVGGVVHWVVHAEETGKVSALTHLLVDVGGNFPCLFPFGHVRLDLRFDPCAHLVAQRGVGIVKVRRGILDWISGVRAEICVTLTPWYHDGSAKGIRSP